MFLHKLQFFQVWALYYFDIWKGRNLIAQEIVEAVCYRGAWILLSAAAAERQRGYSVSAYSYAEISFIFHICCLFLNQKSLIFLNHIIMPHYFDSWHSTRNYLIKLETN